VNIRRLRALEALAERPGTPAEGAAARATIERIPARLGITPRRPARPPKPKPRTWRDLPLVMSETIVCDAPSGVFRACKCDCYTFEVMAGVGRHVAQLRCNSCSGAADGSGGNTLRPPLPIER
jgi:hypothetical protein